MSDDFEKLKNIGAQKIHERTHIARAYVQAILHESFEEMNNVQLLGFISILEREYSLDLSGLKQKAKEYFKNSPSITQNTGSVKIFKASNKRRNLIWIYTAIIIVIVAISAIFSTDSSNNEISKIDNSAINDAKNNIINIVEDKNRSALDENQSIKSEEALKSEELIKQDQVSKEQESIIKEDNIKDENLSLKIMPKSRVWLGYIDLSNHKKHQSIFSDEFVLDPKKDWLLAFGHGHIDIEVNGVVTKYKNPRNVRFSYIDSELKEIDLEEFKRLNEGSGW